MSADNLPPSKVGDRLKADEWNAVKGYVKTQADMPIGFGDAAGARAAGRVDGNKYCRINVKASATIEPYSIFSLTGVDAPDSNVPVRVKSAETLGAATGSPLCYYTNDAIRIPSGKIGWARPVDIFDIVLCRYVGERPGIGEPVGLSPESSAVVRGRFGFVVVGYDELNDADRLKIIRSPEPAGLAAIVSEKITQYDYENGIFGKGKIKFRYRAAGEDEGSTSGSVSADEAQDALNPNDGEEWELPCFNFNPSYSYAVGTRGHCVSALGVGLLFFPDPCAFVLEDCRNNLPNGYASNCSLLEHVDKVVRIRGYDTCWRVRFATDSDNAEHLRAAISVEVTAVYDDCTYCGACYKLTDCDEGSESEEGFPEIIYTNTDLSEFVGKILRLKTPTTRCYTVAVASNCLNAQPVTFRDGDYYETCDGCSDYCYHMVGCIDAEWTLVIDNNLPLLATRQLRETNPDQELLTPEDIDGKVFEVDGVCMRVDGYDTNCDYVETDRVIGMYFEDCIYCGCYKLTLCEFGSEASDSESAAVIYAKAAYEGGEFVNLRDYLGQIVRLDDGSCYSIEFVTEGCEGAQDIQILEFYGSCPECVVYTLESCLTQSTLTTHTDLAGLGYEVGDYIQLDDGGCHLILNNDAVWTEGETFDVSPMPGATPYPNCETCQQEVIYLLSNTCIADECAAAAEGSGSQETAGAPDIYTRVDLHAHVGQYVKYQGVCYVVSVVGSTSGDFEETDIGTEWQAFPTCEECKTATVSWSETIITALRMVPDEFKVQYKQTTRLVTGTHNCPSDWITLDEGEDCGSASGSV